MSTRSRKSRRQYRIAQPPTRVPIEVSVSNIIGFLPTRAFPVEYSRTLSDTITLTGEAPGFGGYGTSASASNTITFTQTVTKTGTSNISLDHTIIFNQDGRRTLSDSASNTVTFTNAVYSVGVGESTVTFTQTVTATNTKLGKSTVTFTQAVTSVSTFNLSLSNSFLIDGWGLGYKQATEQYSNIYGPHSATPTNKFNWPPTWGDKIPNEPKVPPGDVGSVTIEDATSTLTLRSPEFGNQEILNIYRAYNPTRHNQINQSGNQNWPKSKTLVFRFIAVPEAVVIQLRATINKNLGKDVTLVDHEGIEWLGVITNSDAAMVERKNNECDYEVFIEFIGTEVIPP